jgi:putative oxidoreductase
LLAGVVLIYDGVNELLLTPSRQAIVLQTASIATGILLLIGFWTPVAGILAIATQLCIATTATASIRNCIVSASLGAALAMLGPGVRSVDARLFGRKRVDIRDRRGDVYPPPK